MAPSRHVPLDEDLYDSSPTPSDHSRNAARVNGQDHSSISSPPASHASTSSDKENRTSTRAMSGSREKGKSAMPIRKSKSVERPEKRRRLTDQGDDDVDDDDSDDDSDADEPSVITDNSVNGNREKSSYVDLRYYDPDQSMDVRREVRKGLRDLTRGLQESSTEYLAPNSSGILETLQEANKYFSNVRQTSDAIIDSRLLVSAADLSYKKTAQLTLGETDKDIDIDEFVGKCISFMRYGDGSGNRSRLSNVSATQGRSRRNGRQNNNSSFRVDHHDDEDGNGSGSDDGDALNWELLGRKACFPYNSRPPLSGFLLGPLSIQKRARIQRPNRERQQRRNPADVVRPTELQAEDIEKAENSNLTYLCTKIKDLLGQINQRGEAAVEKLFREDMTDKEYQDLLDEYCMSDNSGVDFFRFILHPRSFGQTVENLFYISFLIREGNLGISSDTHGLPSLHLSDPRQLRDIKEKGLKKNQAIFHLDYRTWRELVKAYNIKKPTITDRTEEKVGARGGTTVKGWYG